MKPSRPTPPPIDSQLGKQHPLRILLAEDNLINQKVALQLLARIGYQADVVIDGLQVLEALRRQPYDVVLMDMQMPQMDGLTATRYICQEWSKAERPRIIAMTANAMQGDREECLEAGMDDYLGKPIRVDALMQVLSQCQSKVGTGVMETEEQRGGVSPLLPNSPPPSSSPTPDSQPPTPLDTQIFQSLRNMIGTKADVVLAEMIDCYLEEAPQLINAIASAIAQGNAVTLRRAAHTLKSSSITLGATTLSNFCQELEAMSRSGNTQEGVDKLLQLQAEYERVKTALQIERQQIHL